MPAVAKAETVIAARGLKRTSLRQLHQGLLHIISKLETPPHELDDVEFSALMQLLRQYANLQESQLKLLEDLRVSIKAGGYPRQVEEFLLYEVQTIPDECDQKTRNQRLAEVRRNLLKTPAELMARDERPSVQLPTEGQAYHRPDRWGKKVDTHE